MVIRSTVISDICGGMRGVSGILKSNTPRCKFLTHTVLLCLRYIAVFFLNIQIRDKIKVTINNTCITRIYSNRRKNPAKPRTGASRVYNRLCSTGLCARGVWRIHPKTHRKYTATAVGSPATWQKSALDIRAGKMRHMQSGRPVRISIEPYVVPRRNIAIMMEETQAC